MMKKILFILTTSILIFFSCIDLIAQNTITVIVKDIRNANGVVSGAIYTKETWLSKIECMAEVSVSSNTGTVTLVFENIPVGKEYAVAILHDEDENDDCTLSLIGLPKEGVGFSNDAPIKLGPPKFKDAKFLYNGGKIVKIIKCRYRF